MKFLLGTTIDQFLRMPEYMKTETRVEMRLQFAKEYAAKAVKVHIDNKVGALVNVPGTLPQPTRTPAARAATPALFRN
jgi:hypothetical protein